MIANRKVDISGKIKTMECGIDSIAVLTEEGSLYTWGSNKYAQLGYKPDDEISYITKNVDIPKK